MENIQNSIESGLTLQSFKFRLPSIKMEVFTLIQNHFATCGIAVTQKLQKTHPFNLKNLTVFILLCVFIILIAASLDETNTFDDFTDISFRCVSNSACNLVYAIIVWKTAKLFEFINCLADIVKLSE